MMTLCSLSSARNARIDGMHWVRGRSGKTWGLKLSGRFVKVCQARESVSETISTARTTMDRQLSQQQQHREKEQDAVLHALSMLWNDVRYLEDHTGLNLRKSIETMTDVHDVMVAALNPVAGEEIQLELEKRIAGMQAELEQAHQALHENEARLQDTIAHLSQLEKSVKKLSLVDGVSDHVSEKAQKPSANEMDATVLKKRRDLTATLDLSEGLKQFWYPIEFSNHVQEDIMIPIELFGEPWVIFRDTEGIVGCIKDECAHRACPISIGGMVDGQPQCPYHGWQYDREGQCTKMPSTAFCSGVAVKSLPVAESDGMVWVWPGSMEGELPPPPEQGSMAPPKGFTTHAEIVMDVPVDYGLLVENLLDLAHAPFTHTSTFAKGWAVPDLVNFDLHQSLSGAWKPYPINMKFAPPCGVFSTIGLAKPGKVADGVSADACKNHLHQMHMCVPASKGTTRLLYRMSLDFMNWVQYIPGIQSFWKYIASQVLGEDLVLVVGQQQRVEAGSEIWQNPVPYDKLGVRYRRWRNQVSGYKE